MPPFSISKTFADEPAASELLAELDAGLETFYPREHIFGLHPNEERDPELHFFVAYEGESAVGCGALRVLDSDTGEIKRMYVRPAFRGRGISRKILTHLEVTARGLGLSCVRLETGPEQLEALGLYRKQGYVDIPPYGEYIGSPVSMCMEKLLS